MKLRQWIQPVVIGAGALAVLYLGYFCYQWMTQHPIKAKEEVRPEVVPVVKVITVASMEETLTVEAQGKVRAVRESDVVAQVSGKVIELSPKLQIGGHFDEGEWILKIDDSDYRNAVEQASASLLEAESALLLEEARAAQAVADWKRLGRGEELTELTKRTPQLKSAQARVKSAQAALDLAKRNLERTTVSAPFDCVVSSKGTEVGSNLAPNQVIAMVFSAEERELPLSLPLSELAYLPTGEGLSGLTGLARAEIAGEIQEWQVRFNRSSGRINEQTMSADWIFSIKEKVGKEGAFAVPPPGIFLNVTLQGKKVEGWMVIPRDGLREGEFVYLLEQGRLNIQKVEVARKEEKRIWIRQGIKPGDKVIVSALNAPIQGMNIEEHKEDAADSANRKDS